VVATSSATAVGFNRDPAPLDEDAEWGVHGIDVPYAESRREAERLALSRSRPGFEVVVVAPALTIGPGDFGLDFGPAPGGSLIERVIAGRFVLTFDVGAASRTPSAKSRTSTQPTRSAAVPASLVTRSVNATPHSARGRGQGPSVKRVAATRRARYPARDGGC
jgi:hypothetical protein